MTSWTSSLSFIGFALNLAQTRRATANLLLNEPLEDLWA